ncbi:MAG: hypothetical protein WKH64_00125 [Chloroflexia bacterium]
MSAATTIAPTEVVSAGSSEPDPSPAEPVVSASNGESNAAATALLKRPTRKLHPPRSGRPPNPLGEAASLPHRC